MTSERSLGPETTGPDPGTAAPDRAPAGPDAAPADNASVRAELPADLSSPGQARAAIRDALSQWGMSRMSGDVELMASELVANAAEHGDGQPISLALHRHPDRQPGITCEITGASPTGARPGIAGPDAERGRGRGLAIIDALASTSGVRDTGAGKASWFTLALTDKAHRVARQIDRDLEPGG